MYIPNLEKTPLTDAECANNGIGLPLPQVSADFARKLEMKLNEANAVAEALKHADSYLDEVEDKYDKLKELAERVLRGLDHECRTWWNHPELRDATIGSLEAIKEILQEGLKE